MVACFNTWNPLHGTDIKLKAKPVKDALLYLQGEVEQISMMKPKALTEHEEGMLEYLEDIIGSSCYKQPIEECAKAVEDLNEARGEKVILLCVGR